LRWQSGYWARSIQTKSLELFHQGCERCGCPDAEDGVDVMVGVADAQ